VEHIEVYSCFPAAVQVQQRELGLPLDGTPTVTGGMAFAGGPFNNYVYQATAAVVGRLREHPGDLGLVTTVSGLLTKPGLAVWSAQPGEPPLVADLAEAAAQETATVDIAAEYDGPATATPYTVASYTVVSAFDAPDRLVVVADTPAGRTVATTLESSLVTEATARELIGTSVSVKAGAVVGFD
jgi:acetyl-CoA C-acetyltransferase